MLKQRAVIALVLSLVSLSLWVSPPALAASQPLSIQISPLPIDLNATPGTSVSTDIRVRNAGAQNEVLKITLESVTQNGADGEIELHNFTTTDPVPSWVHFSQTTFNAPAGEWQTIKMTVNVPKTAAYGYYYAVQFQLASSAKSLPGQTAIQGAADMFVLLNAEAPGEVTKANIVSFSAAHTLYSYLPVSFNIRVHNSGNIQVAPHGNIFIDKGSSQVDSINVNSSLGDILPNSNRLFGASWSDGFPVYKDIVDANGQTESNGHGGVKQSLSWNFSQLPKLRFGHYTAKLYLIYNDGQGDVPITASVSFWVIPWAFVAIFLVILLILGVGIFAIARKLMRPLKKKPENP